MVVGVLASAISGYFAIVFLLRLVRTTSYRPFVIYRYAIGVAILIVIATGLRLGVDDWITKPSHPEEAIARIEAVTRRHRRGRHETESSPVLAGELEIRPDRFQAFVSGESLDLTRREFELLHLLAGTQGQVLERETIYQRVWGYAMAHGDRSVDVFIRKLRQKLEKRSPEWEYIHTHFGVGYRFDPEPSADAVPQAGPPTPAQASSDDRGSQVVHKSFTAA
ncbi:MAG: winged helix-turn-helix domain-containing protein [Actinobacteria bacterium]|nr:winged helix-turn-helix domain-containing protein [Actinomycetota bacterium]